MLPRYVTEVKAAPAPTVMTTVMMIKPHGDLVGHHLRRRAQRAQEGVLGVRRPARHDNAVHAQRRDREQVQQAEVDIRNGEVFRDRHHRPGQHGQRKGQHRREKEHDFVGAGGQDHFLEHQLERIRPGLQHAKRALRRLARGGTGPPRSPCAPPASCKPRPKSAGR